MLQESGRQRDLTLRQCLGLLREHRRTHYEIIRIRINIMGPANTASQGLENIELRQCVRVTHVESVLSQ